MSWASFQEKITGVKPLFLAIYVTVLMGILFSAVYIFSAIYGTDLFQTDKITSSRDSQFSLREVSIFSPSTAKIRDQPHLTQAQDLCTRSIWDVPPASTKIPHLKKFKLTKEMVKCRAKDNVIIVTFGNYAFMDFILNWVKHLTDLDVFNLLVGAMDVKLLEALYWKGVPVFDMGSNMNTDDVGWGSPTFHKMGREKVILIDAMLPFGYELLMCDTDMVWLKNPLPYLARFPEADILTSSDQLVPTVADDRLDNWQEVTGAYNIGIFHWRSTNSSKKLAKDWKKLLLADKSIWDQNGFNELLHKRLGPSADSETGLVYAFDGSLKIGILPASIFCSGHTYFIQAMCQQLRLEPYAVHTTFQFGGTEGKRHRLREAMIFYDPPEYYDSPGGFLSYKPRIPKNLLLDGEHNIQSHFSLVNYQIKQIRTALAIASLLNRTLVMPPLWCRLDRLWFGHPGILPGTLTRQPFLCPLDHVFEVNVMLRKQSEKEFGPMIDFREYSFLTNPLLPKKIKDSWLDVQLCEEGFSDCGTIKELGAVRVFKFPRNSSELEIISAFSMYKDVKVIQFSSIDDAFQGFTDKVREEKFRKRVQQYAGLWCCVEGQTPGHIYYDMYWDEKPDWKPSPPK